MEDFHHSVDILVRDGEKLGWDTAWGCPFRCVKDDVAPRYLMEIGEVLSPYNVECVWTGPTFLKFIELRENFAPRRQGGTPYVDPSDVLYTTRGVNCWRYGRALESTSSALS